MKGATDVAPDWTRSEGRLRPNRLSGREAKRIARKESSHRQKNKEGGSGTHVGTGSWHEN